MFASLIAWIASLITCSLLIPQTIAAVHGDPIAIPRYKLYLIGVASLLWSVNGIIEQHAALMFSGPVLFICSIIILNQLRRQSGGTNQRSRHGSRIPGRSPVRTRPRRH
ncbi:MAG: hypothetical protein ACOCXQ_05115 [Patescibacteria group bacterium]